MPDLFAVLMKRWKFIFGLTLVATVVALLAALLGQKKFLSTATAIPANTQTADRARVFNNNIQMLYSDFGAAEELDRLEGAAQLDTIFMATVDELVLTPYYGFKNDPEGPYKAAMELKKNTRINRTGFGELKVKVWDKDKNQAAAMCNTLLRKIQDLYRNLQNAGNLAVLDRTQLEYEAKQLQYRSLSDSNTRLSGADAELNAIKKSALLDQLSEYEKIINQYQLAARTNPPVLLTVEPARPSLWPDKPQVVPTVLISLFGTFVFAFLMAIFVESSKTRR